MRNLLLFSLLALTIVSCNKYEKSIEILNNLDDYSELILEEGRKDRMLPIIDDSIINYIVESGLFKDITRLEIENCPDISHRGYQRLQAFKNVKYLYLTELPISSKSLNLLISNSDSVRRIALRNLENIDSIVFKNILEWTDFDIDDCESLQYIKLKNAEKYSHLSMSGCINSGKFIIELENSDRCFITIFKEDISNDFQIRSDSFVYSISMIRCNMSSVGKHYFSSFKNAERIFLENVNLDNIFISDLNGLKEVHIESYLSNRDDKNNQLTKISFENLPSLKKINLLSDSLREISINKTDSLRIMYLRTKHPLFDFKSFSEIQKLEYLDFIGTNMQNHLLEKFLEIPELFSFDYYPDTVTNSQIQLISESSTLSKLEIEGLRNEKDLNKILGMENINSLSLSSPFLQEINIDSHKSLEYIDISRSSLKKLNIANCMNLKGITVTYSSPEHINIENIPNLSRLRLNLCSVKDLDKFLKNLRLFFGLSSIDFELCDLNLSLDLRTLRDLDYLRITNHPLKEVILNKVVEDDIYLNDYKGSVRYVEY